MKAFLLSLIVAGISLQTNAQEADPERSTGPVKLSDIVASHEQLIKSIAKDKRNAEADSKEDEDYHFYRWHWYWQHHTDENGYLVSPVKIQTEWAKLKQAQYKTTASNNSNWVFKGLTVPGTTTTWTGNNGVGRITTMAFHPTDSNTYWAGSASGGLWRTTNNGQTWTCLTDALPVISISDVDINPKNPNVIYICTGDRDAREHYSVGVWRSRNGGATWDTTGIKWDPSLLRLTNCLAINAKDTSSLILAASDGIYKSFNSGNVWTNVRAGNYKQVLYHPTDTNIIYATSFDTVSGNKSSQIFRSVNGGLSWTQVTNFTKAWRIQLAVTTGNVAIVKALVASKDPARYKGMEGFYSSSDTGKTYTLIATDSNCTRNILSSDYAGGTGCSGQGNYDLCVTIDPKDTNKVYVGAVNTWLSVNGGAKWRLVTAWNNYLSGVPVIHADIHHVEFHPLLPGRLFQCNDGGIYYTDKPEGPGSFTNPTWKNVTLGMGITQFYRLAVSDNRNTVLGGSQDNATNELRGGAWRYEIGGDGMECHYDFSDTSYSYGSLQRGDILRRFKGTYFTTDISTNIPGNPTGGWVTPYILNPANSAHLFAGYQDLFYTQDRGNTWLKVNNAPLCGKYMLRVAMTPASPGDMYATVEDSNIIYYTKTFAAGSATTFSVMTPPYTGKVISDIKTDMKTADHFWVTYGGFNSVRVAEYKSGVWKQMDTGLPNVPVWCMEQDTSNGTLYIGTDVGVFYLNDSTASIWYPYNTNMPSVHVTDLGIHYKNKELWAATYGRGMWVSPLQDLKSVPPPDTTDTTTVINVLPLGNGSFSIYPNPTDGRLTIKTIEERYQAKDMDIIITDPTGKVVWKNTGFMNHYGRMSIDVTGLAKGVYIMEMRIATETVGHKRLIIN